ncbi:MAG TPA: BlaI/MecI/CopY family transcriptional regulator [Pirellulales bacterium]|jgi:predicted transcriptional regulator
MARPASEHPTELELEILKVLWGRSPLPVRDVRLDLEKQAGRALSHSSVITMLNIMVRKGYLGRKKLANAFLFAPKVKKEDIAGGIVGDLLSRVFGGSSSAMVLNLIETADLGADELADLRRLISRKAAEQKK